MAHDLEIRIIQQMHDIIAPTDEVIIHRQNIMPTLQQGFADLRAKKSCSNGDKDAFFRITDR